MKFYIIEDYTTGYAYQMYGVDCSQKYGACVHDDAWTVQFSLIQFMFLHFWV